MPFLHAEAALRLGNTGVTKSYFQAGLTAPMTKIGMTTAEINQYFITSPL